jgi:hypothetical protein
MSCSLRSGFRFSCTPLHCFLSLEESPSQIGVRDADTSWDHSSNHVSVVRASRAGPHLHAVPQHGGNILYAD